MEHNKEYKTLIGFLASNGIFYACDYGGHYSLACKLCENYFKNEYKEYRYENDKLYVNCPQDYLMSKGFFKFTEDAIYCYKNVEKRAKFTFNNIQALFLEKSKLNKLQEQKAIFIFKEEGFFNRLLYGDENLKPYEPPRIIHTMGEYPKPTKFIKIIREVPVEKRFRPTVGEIYPVIKEGGEYAHLYFILVNGEEVGIYPHGECVIVEN